MTSLAESFRLVFLLYIPAMAPRPDASEISPSAPLPVTEVRLKLTKSTGITSFNGLKVLNVNLS